MKRDGKSLSKEKEFLELIEKLRRIFYSRNDHLHFDRGVYANQVVDILLDHLVKMKIKKEDLKVYILKEVEDKSFREIDNIMGKKKRGGAYSSNIMKKLRKKLFWALINDKRLD